MSNGGTSQSMKAVSLKFGQANSDLASSSPATDREDPPSSHAIPETNRGQQSYGGQAAVMSFNPAQIADLRAIAPRLTRGIAVRNPAWAEVTASPRRALAGLRQVLPARPQFLAYSIANLPALVPTLAQNLFGLPLLAWTVRSADDQRKAARYADQMIFEGFRP